MAYGYRVPVIAVSGKHTAPGTGWRATLSAHPQLAEEQFNVITRAGRGSRPSGGNRMPLAQRHACRGLKQQLSNASTRASQCVHPGVLSTAERHSGQRVRLPEFPLRG